MLVVACGPFIDLEFSLFDADCSFLSSDFLKKPTPNHSIWIGSLLLFFHNTPFFFLYHPGIFVFAFICLKPISSARKAMKRRHEQCFIFHYIFRAYDFLWLYCICVYNNNFFPNKNCFWHLTPFSANYLQISPKKLRSSSEFYNEVRQYYFHQLVYLQDQKATS